MEPRELFVACGTAVVDRLSRLLSIFREKTLLTSVQEWHDRHIYKMPIENLYTANITEKINIQIRRRI